MKPTKLSVAKIWMSYRRGAVLSTRKRFEEPVGNAAHLLNRVIDHTVPFGAGREANRNTKLPGICFLHIIDHVPDRLQ